VGRAFEFDPIVVGELDDFSLPECLLVLVNLFPKVAAPQKITFVDIEIVGVGKAAQQRGGQRNGVRTILDRRRAGRRSWRGRILLVPLSKERLDFRVLGAVGSLSLLPVQSAISGML
jgi:hypothetical protein